MATPSESWQFPSAVASAFETEHPESILALFQDMTRRLRVRYPIDRAVLIVGNRSRTEYRATACFEGGRPQHLSLTLPGESSLLRQVADGGSLYTESFCELFSGNDIERALLLADDAEAVAIVPVKCDASVVGLIGLSSHDPMAFVMFEEDCLGGSREDLGRLIAASQA